MIIKLSIENWMSFHDKASFSMIASKERQHNERLPRIDKYKSRLLPIAAIYGANASGKSNLCQALHFAQNLVVKGTRPETLIPVEPFRLTSMKKPRPSRFTFELLIGETIYEFSFAVTSKAIVEERLVEISSSSEKTLYDRKFGKPNFHKSLAKEQFLQFAFRGTRDNQLFLTNSVSQKVMTFKPIHDWFKNNLELIAPDSRFEPFEQFLDENDPLYRPMNEMLASLDTGISHLGAENVPWDNLPLPSSLKAQLQREAKEGKSLRIRIEGTNERYIVTRKNDKLVAKKLVSYHPTAKGDEIKFEINQESDGSKRIIDLLPAFLELINPSANKVYIVDEVDRSLHTHMTHRLIENYLASCSEDSRNQLLITTHDVLLMDQNLLRRDEMWITERDASSNSRLFSLSEYKNIRYDKDIRKSYLQGRLGGIPNFLAD